MLRRGADRLRSFASLRMTLAERISLRMQALIVRNVDKQTNGAPMNRGAVDESKVKKERKLNGLGCCASRRSGPGKGVRTGFLLRVLVDLDGAFEVGAVFDHDAGSGQVTIDRTVLLDFNSVLRAKVALHVAVHHDFAGNDIGGYFC